MSGIEVTSGGQWGQRWFRMVGPVVYSSELVCGWIFILGSFISRSHMMLVNQCDLWHVISACTRMYCCRRMHLHTEISL